MLPQLITEIPGPRSRALALELKRYESRNVTYSDAEFPVFWSCAEGTNVWDADGNRFIDLSSAFGVAGLGHSRVRDALIHQAGKLLHAMGDVHPAEIKVALCRKLSELTFERWGVGEGKTILANSGFEAVEAALKTSLLYSGKPGVIAFKGAYHGLGYGALESSGIPYFKDPFRAQLRDFATLVEFPDCHHCPGDAGHGFPACSQKCLGRIREQIEKALKEKEIGCILLEPIQGRGGLVIPPLEFLRMLRRICDEHRILLIVDEIYTGLNRTGRLFACDHFGVVPDLICLGKGLTSGFPMSACVGRAAVMDAWPTSTGEALHTSTFLGNPMGCAMALASLEEHSAAQTSKRVQDAGEKLMQALLGLKSRHIRNVRGLGLMQGVELDSGELAIRIVKRALGCGLILLADAPSANVLSFAPPFTISDEEIEFALGVVQENLTSLPGSIS